MTALQWPTWFYLVMWDRLSDDHLGLALNLLPSLIASEKITLVIWEICLFAVLLTISIRSFMCSATSLADKRQTSFPPSKGKTLKYSKASFTNMFTLTMDHMTHVTAYSQIISSWHNSAWIALPGNSSGPCGSAYVLHHTTRNIWKIEGYMVSSRSSLITFLHFF